MTGRGMVRGRVLTLRVVAAADVPTALAHAQMDPLHTELQAHLTAGDLRRRVEDLDCADVGAGGRTLTIARSDRATGTHI